MREAINPLTSGKCQRSVQYKSTNPHVNSHNTLQTSSSFRSIQPLFNQFLFTQLNLCNKKQDVCFEFENSSPYIPEEKQKSIFAQYVSYATMHKELGIGLGLYASQKIIDGHKGQIYVNSFVNDKNIFGFIIPRVQEEGYIKEICF